MALVFGSDTRPRWHAQFNSELCTCITGERSKLILEVSIVVGSRFMELCIFQVQRQRSKVFGSA